MKVHLVEDDMPNAKAVTVAGDSILMQFYAIIQNAYPAAIRCTACKIPLSRVKPIVTYDKSAYADHWKEDLRYAQFIIALWNQIGEDRDQVQQLIDLRRELSKEKWLYVGIGVVRELQLNADDIQFLKSIESPDFFN
ncbi:MAG: hypothetical protein KW802_03380 [Candidatus Doudnabacteria bacterium]|nr:hypothetical protein [Candidatus Doudnabacteria bacterium]